MNPLIGIDFIVKQQQSIPYKIQKLAYTMALFNAINVG
jgi:hypothetical protein